MKYILIIVATLFLCCKSDKAAQNLAALDLMKHGLPIKINAPADAVVKVDDLGIMKDVTVMGDNNYSLQILSGTLTTTDLASIKTAQLAEVKAGAYFAEIIQEDEHGFIYKKKISEDRINYDFRYTKIQGDQEYIFQTGLAGKFTLDEVKAIYHSVQ